MLPPSLSLSGGSAALAGFQPLCPAAGGTATLATAATRAGATAFADVMSGLAPETPACEPSADLAAAALAAGLIAGFPPAVVAPPLDDAPALDEAALLADGDAESGDDLPGTGDLPGDDWSDPAAADDPAPLAGVAPAARDGSAPPVFPPLGISAADSAAPRVAPTGIDAAANSDAPLSSVPVDSRRPAEPVGPVAEPSAVSIAPTTTATPNAAAFGGPAALASNRPVEFEAFARSVRRATPSVSTMASVPIASPTLSPTPVSPGTPAAATVTPDQSAVAPTVEVAAAMPSVAAAAPAWRETAAPQVAAPLPALRTAEVAVDATAASPAPLSSASLVPAASAFPPVDAAPAAPAPSQVVSPESPAGEFTSAEPGTAFGFPSAPNRTDRRASSAEGASSTLAPAGVAKFAGLFRGAETAEETSDRVGVKKILNTEGQELGVGEEAVGTGIANLRSAMPYASNFPAPAPAATGGFASAGDPSIAGQTAATEFRAAPDSPAAAPAATTAQAVEAVLDAAQVAADARRSTVELKFTVGGSELQVRVDLRQDEVQATFRTESPDLRHALAHEWDSVVTAAAAERGVRLLPAIFSSAATQPDAGQSGAFNFAGGDQSAAQREAQTRRSESTRTGALARRAAATVAVAPDAGGPVPRVSLPTSRHLHTLA